MPVDTKNEDYSEHIAKWIRIRDVLGGVDSVKMKGETYLPKPNGHDDQDYSSYITRAEFYPATTRTVDGLVGAIFRKEPQIETPDGQDELIKATTVKGIDFTTFSKKVVREILTMGRYGVLVDVMGGEDKKPFAAGYTAESVINWHVEYSDRQPVLSLVVLQENVVKQKEGDPFASELVERYRVLSLGDPEGLGQRVYFQTLFEKQSDGGKDSFVQLGSVIPTRRGETMDRIPFFFFGPLELAAEVEKSPILDLVDTNISHYRTSAELEEGAYFTGLPMYVISGRVQGSTSEGVAEFAVGSRNALMLDAEGSAQILTVSGEGMGLLRSLMDDKEQRMAVLGARILEDQKAGVEAAATVSMRHRGENSLLGSISDTVSRGLGEVLETMIWWNGVDAPEVSVGLNKDFTSLQLTGAEMVQLTAAFQTGSIGPEVFFKALKDGERVPDGWDVGDWLADINEGADAFDRGLTNETPELEDEAGLSDE